MDVNKKCPLCNKEIAENKKFCDDCDTHIKYQYQTTLLAEKTQESSENEISETVDSTESVVEESVLDQNTEVEQISIITLPKKRVSKGLIFVYICCFLLVLAGAWGAYGFKQQKDSVDNELKYWDNCALENTVLSYSKYLVAYPEGRFVDEANSLIDSIEQDEVKTWEKLKKSSDLNKFYTYIADNPKSPYMKEIRSIMDSLSWLSATKDSTAESFKAYLENIELGNITGKYKIRAQSNYDYLSSIVTLDSIENVNLLVDLKDFYLALSANKQKELLRLFAPSVDYFSNKKSSTQLVADLNKQRSEDKIKSIDYSIDEASVYAKKDRDSIMFVEYAIKTVTAYNVRQKKEVSTTQKIYMELNKEKQIRLIQEKKK